MAVVAVGAAGEPDGCLFLRRLVTTTALGVVMTATNTFRTSKVKVRSTMRLLARKTLWPMWRLLWVFREITFPEIACLRSRDDTRGHFDVNIDDLGGMNETLDLIMNQIFPNLPSLKTGNLKRVLLHGKPGTGKTLLAKVLAEKLYAAEYYNLVIKPRLFSIKFYYLQHTVIQLLDKAAKDYRKKGNRSRLHVIILDDIECFNPGGKLSLRLLQKLDEISALNNIFIISITNRIDVVDHELLRRFDMKLMIDLPNEEARLDILKAKTRQIQRKGYFEKEEDIDLASIASHTAGFTHADLAQLPTLALSRAIGRVPRTDGFINDKHIKICHDDFMKAIDFAHPCIID